MMKKVLKLLKGMICFFMKLDVEASLMALSALWTQTFDLIFKNSHCTRFKYKKVPYHVCHWFHVTRVCVCLSTHMVPLIGQFCNGL